MEIALTGEGFEIIRDGMPIFFANAPMTAMERGKDTTSSMTVYSEAEEESGQGRDVQRHNTGRCYCSASQRFAASRSSKVVMFLREKAITAL
jgi:hypothetical protein